MPVSELRFYWPLFPHDRLSKQALKGFFFFHDTSHHACLSKLCYRKPVRTELPMSASGIFQGRRVCCSGPDCEIATLRIKSMFCVIWFGLVFFNFLSVDHFRLTF
jgi:hypothetical protein